MKRAAATCVSALLLIAAPCAETRSAESVVYIGGATIRFNLARFAVTATHAESAYFSPQGATAEDMSPVEVRIHSGAGSQSCVELSRRAFGAGLYDATRMQTSVTTIGGLAAERFAAHTRCRDATPMGEIACVKAGDSAYLFSVLHTGCRGGKPFSQADPLAEILAGVAFERAR